MESPAHNVYTLFQQLGLDDTDEALERFISQHKPIDHKLLLHEADIWNSSQASFLKQALEEDADWSLVVDQLDAMLR